MCRSWTLGIFLHFKETKLNESQEMVVPTSACVRRRTKHQTQRRANLLTHLPVYALVEIHTS